MLVGMLLRPRRASALTWPGSPAKEKDGDTQQKSLPNEPKKPRWRHRKCDFEQKTNPNEAKTDPLADVPATSEPDSNPSLNRPSTPVSRSDWRGDVFCSPPFESRDSRRTGCLCSLLGLTHLGRPDLAAHRSPLPVPCSPCCAHLAARGWRRYAIGPVRLAVAGGAAVGKAIRHPL
jgi:hypothetical protein